jgi:hypothetical protein
MADRIQRGVALARALQGFKSREPGAGGRTSGTIRELFSGTKLRKLSFNDYFPATAVIRAEYVNDIIQSNNLKGLEKLAVLEAYKLTVEEIYANTAEYPTLTDSVFDNIVRKISKFVAEFNKQLRADNDKVDNTKLVASFTQFQDSLTTLGENNFIKFFVVRDNTNNGSIDGLTIPSLRVVGRSYSYLQGSINKLLSKNLKKAINTLNLATEEQKKQLEKDFDVTKSKPESSKLTAVLANWGHTPTTIRNIVSGKPETIILSGKVMATLLSIGRSVGIRRDQLSIGTAKVIQEDFIAVTGQISSSMDLTQAVPGSLELKIVSSGYFQQLRPEFGTGNQGRGSTVERSWGIQQVISTNQQALQDLATVLQVPPKVSAVMGRLIDISASPTYKQNLIAQAVSPLTGGEFKFKPTKIKLLQNSKKTVGKMTNLTKKSKLPKTPGSKKLSVSPSREVPISLVNLPMLMLSINSNLHDQIKANMGTGNRRDVLNYRTGRFAESAKVERLSESRQGMITAFYSYMKNPYATFSRGGRQDRPYTRDPKLLISKSIRELAGNQIANRMRAVLI